ncbi:MAG TPA: alpha/beta hydrolase [Micropepsaceae bacterium]|jgi:pimeloyl-ACP methyl ester carboxylesterase|nr:alpha/beta hydrolase [Micropepsaceae bacterium]
MTWKIVSRVAALSAFALIIVPMSKAADDSAPLMLARDGYFYVNAKTIAVDGKSFVTNQMYVEERVPARRTHAYPIVMVHGGTMSGVNFTGTPDGREGWAQYFVRQGYAVYVVDQPGRGRSGYLPATYGPARNVESTNSFARFVAQEKSKLWPQAALHTQWPGDGTPNDPAAQQVMASQLPAIASFEKQQFLNRDALIALFEKIGPGILLVHSQAGAFGWPVADSRPDLIKAILAIEPNGPPAHGVEFIGAPDWFKEGPVSNTYGLTSVPLNYAPAVKSAAELSFVREDKADGPGLVTCWKQKEPARQLPNLQKMPVLVVTSEASYHAPYDHCTVKYLSQAGVHPAWIKLADIGIHGNSHVMMMEKNNKDIAAVIANWLDKSLPKEK